MGQRRYPISEPVLNPTGIFHSSKPLFCHACLSYPFNMTRTLLSLVPALTLALSLAACSHSKPARDAGPTPQADADIPTGETLYAMFPVPPAAAFKGKPAAPNFKAASSHAHEYEKELRTTASRGPNFAGNVILATVRCGKNCQEIFILSARTGK